MMFDRSRSRWLPRDEGSGTVLMVGLVLLTGFLIVVVLSMAAAIITRHRAGATADLAALAAVSGSSGSPDCAQAQRVTAANRGRLVGCHAMGDGSIVVVVESAGGSWALFGTARVSARASPGPYLPLGLVARPRPVSSVAELGWPVPLLKPKAEIEAELVTRSGETSPLW